MSWQYTPTIWPLIVAAAVSTVLAFFTWRRRASAGPLTLFTLSAALWSLSYALELASITVPAKLFWIKFEYPGIVTAPVAWLMYVLQYTGQERWLTRRNVGLLFVIPLMTVALNWTNDIHHLFYADVSLDISGSYVLANLTYGIGFWPHLVYSYLVLLAATVLIIWSFVRASQPVLYRWQALSVAIGALMPWFANVLYVTGISANLDLTPFAFTLTGMTVFLGMLHFRLLDIVPAAHHAVFQSMSDGVIVLDAQNRIVNLNPAAEHIINRRASEVIGQPIHIADLGLQTLVPEAKRNRIADLGVQAWHSEIRIPHSEMTFDLRISPLRNQRGRLTGRLLVLHNVTERVQAERTLRESVRRFKDIAENALEWIWEVDANGKYTYASPVVEKILGYKPEQVLGKHFYDLFHPKSRKELKRAVFEIFAQKQSLREFINRNVHRNGKTVWLSTSGVPMLDEKGNLLGYRGADIDITERVQAEEERERLLAAEYEQRTLAETLRDVTLALTAQTSYTAVLDEILRQAQRVVPHSTANIALLEGNTLHTVRWQGYQAFGCEAFISNLEQPLANSRTDIQVVESRIPLVIPDTYQDPRWVILKETTWIRSYLSVPICLRDRVLGLLRLDGDTPGEFSAGDAQRLQPLTNAAAVAIENAQLYQESQRRLREVSLLLESSQDVTSTLDLNQVLRRVIEAAIAAIGPAEKGTLHLMDEEQGKLVVQASVGFSPETVAAAHFKPGEGYTGWVFAHRQPLIVNDVRADPHAKLIDLPQMNEEKSALCVPLLVRGKAIGALSLDNITRHGAFTPQHLDLLTIFAGQAAVAIGNARLYQETRQRARERGFLYQVTIAAMTSVHLDEIFESTLDALQKTLQPDSIAILLLEPETDTLVIRAWSGFGPHGPTLIRRAIGVGIPGWVVKTGEPVLLADVRGDGRYHGCDSDTLSELCVPLRIGQRIIGALNLESQRLAAFDQDNLRLLSILAGHLAAVVENARLVEGLAAEVQARTAEIRAEQEKSETILRNVGNAIAMFNAEQRVSYVNPAFSVLTGYPADEALGQDIYFLIGGMMAEQSRQSLQAALAEGESWQGEVSIRRRDGRLYDAALTIAPIRDAGGHLVGYVSSHEDVSRFKELDRGRSRFMTNVSHQLRTPVTSIKLYAHLLRTGKRPEKTEHYLQVLDQQADRLGRLIQDILETTALDSGQAVTAWSPLSIPTIIRDVITRFQSQAQTAGLELEATPLPPHLPTVYGDQTRLAQALGEVVENAVTFTSAPPGRGRVTLEAGTAEEKDQLWVTLAVHDTGPGIPSQEREQVFDRFYRGSLVESGHIPGIGLGLSIAQEILQAHGGRVTVESQVGQGSTFTLWLRAE